MDFVLAPLVSLALSPLVWTVLFQDSNFIGAIGGHGYLLQGFLAVSGSLPKQSDRSTSEAMD